MGQTNRLSARGVANAGPGEVVEMALAHAIRDKTEAAYRRGDLLAKRRELMGDWAGYVVG